MVKPLMLAFLCALFPGQAVAGTAAGSLPASDRGAIVGRDENGGLHLEAREASWMQVLDAVEKATGVRIDESGLDPMSVTASCQGETAEQLVYCLLMHDDRAGNMAEVAGATDNAQTETAAESGPEGVYDGSAFAQTRELLDMAGSPDPIGRGHALSRLALEAAPGDETARGALEAATRDPDPDVRALAVANLARAGGPETAAMLNRAMFDPDPTVRLAAVAQAGVDAESADLLREALRDGDETVRILAETKLELTRILEQMLGAQASDEAPPNARDREAF